MQDKEELVPWTWVLGYLFPASNEKLIAFFAPILVMLDHVLPAALKKLQQACMVHKKSISSLDPSTKSQCEHRKNLKFILFHSLKYPVLGQVKVLVAKIIRILV